MQSYLKGDNMPQKKKDDTTVTFKSGDTEVTVSGEDLTAAANERDIMDRIVQTAGDQVKDQLGNWKESIYRLYKQNGGDMKVSFNVGLESDGTKCKVKTTISFSMGKISDEIEGEVSLQPQLPL